MTNKNTKNYTKVLEKQKLYWYNVYVKRQKKHERRKYKMLKTVETVRERERERA